MATLGLIFLSHLLAGLATLVGLQYWPPAEDRLDVLLDDPHDLSNHPIMHSNAGPWIAGAMIVSMGYLGLLFYLHDIARRGVEK